MFTKTFFIETNDDKVMPTCLYNLWKHFSNSLKLSIHYFQISHLKLIKFSLPGTSKGGDPASKRFLQDVQANRNNKLHDLQPPCDHYPLQAFRIQ